METPTRKEKAKLTALELASVVASWSTALALILGACRETAISS
jgi:hypothetical protein